MQTEVRLPELGVGPGSDMVVSLWFVGEGDEVLEGDRLVEILTGSITVDIPAPANGRLVEIRLVEDDLVHTGDVLGIVEMEEGTEEEPPP